MGAVGNAVMVCDVEVMDEDALLLLAIAAQGPQVVMFKVISRENLVARRLILAWLLSSRGLTCLFESQHFVFFSSSSWETLLQ